MTKIRILRNHDNRIVDFQIEDHTGYAEAGSDIVCSAISALTQTAALGLNEVAGLDIKLDMKDGWLKCVLPDNITEEQSVKSSAILETMLIGLKSMKEGYPQYIDINEMEVE